MAWFMDGENMTGVAEKTGGDLLKGDDAGAQFTELMHRLRMRYSLYYAMPKGKAGDERRIKVQLSKRSAQQRAARQRNASQESAEPCAGPQRVSLAVELRRLLRDGEDGEGIS